MTWVDLVVGIVVMWSGLQGWLRGFWAQVLVVASLVLGVLSALWTYALLAGVGGRGHALASHALRFLVAALIGCIVFGVLQAVALRTGSRLNESILGPLNRACGLFTGLLAGAVSSALLLLALAHAPLPRPARRALDGSWSAPRLFALGAELARDAEHRVPGASALARAFERAERPAGEAR